MASLIIAVVAVLCCAFVLLASSLALATVMHAAWLDAGFRSNLMQVAMVTADQLQHQHRNRPEIARAIVERLQSTPGVTAAVVDDGGNLLAGNAELVSDLKFPLGPPPAALMGGPAASGLAFGGVSPLSGPGLTVVGPPPFLPGQQPGRPGTSASRPLPFVRTATFGGDNVRFMMESPIAFDFGATPPTPVSFLFERVASPRSIVRVGGSLVIIETLRNKVVGIQSTLRIIVFGLLALTFAGVWFTGQRVLAGVVRPMNRVQEALSKLGLQTRLEVLGPEDGLAGDLVRAYNAAAHEMASKYRHRVEVESRMRQFVADAGHELRTPLAVIMGYVQLLRRNATPDDAMSDHVFSEIDDQGRRMNVLIHKLLLLTRLESSEPTDLKILDAADIAQSAVESFRPLRGSSTLVLQLEHDAFVQVSESEMREAFVNLIDNALKYAPGSTIETAVRVEGDCVVAAVTDTGPGMSPEVRAHAFERFSRGELSGSIPGSGLGLAIVERAVERAGGQVTLDTALGKGTVVEMRLPAWLGQAQRS